MGSETVIEAMIDVGDISVGDLLVRVVHVDPCGFYLWGSDNHCTCKRQQRELTVTVRNLDRVRRQIVSDTRRELWLIQSRRN